MINKVIKFFNETHTNYKYNNFLKKNNFYELDKIFTHLTKNEKMKLYNLSLTKTGVFVEIGSYLGASSCIIGKSIQKTNKMSYLYCIDTWQNNAMTEGNLNTFDLFKKNTKKISKVLISKRGKSVEIAQTFNKRIDFLFIDADHSYEGVKADVDAWLPKLNENALVIFHDYGWAEGVKRVVNEEIEPKAKKSRNIENLYWAWL